MTDKSNDVPPAMMRDEPLDSFERGVVESLRVPVSPRDGFDARVMQAVLGEPRHRVAPRPAQRVLHGRRLAALSTIGAALAAALVLMLVGRGSAPEGSIAKRTAALSSARLVRFTLVQPGASRVSVAGSFNGWSTAATPLRHVSGDVWTADIPLGAGRYEYQFVVDGRRWIPDPQAPRDAADDFGASNSVVTVAAQGSA